MVHDGHDDRVTAGHRSVEEFAAGAPVTSGRSPEVRSLAVAVEERTVEVMTNRPPVDVVIIGGGAAGLAAALMLGRSRRSVVVVDAGEPRNAPAGHIHGYLGREGTPPAVLLATGRDEVRRYGVDVLDGRATRAERADGTFMVFLADGGVVCGRRLLVATGLADELPAIPGLAERWGRDVVHCAYCHGWELGDRPIAVLATGPMGVHQASMFRQLSPDVTLIVHAGPPPTPARA